MMQTNRQFEQQATDNQFDKVGMYACEYGYTLICEKKVWDGDGLSWKVRFAMGPEPEKLESAQDIHYKPETDQNTRVQMTLLHAENWMKHRDYYGDPSRR